MKKSLWLAMSAVLLTAAVIVLPLINSKLVQSKPPASQEVSRSDHNIVERSEPDTEPKKDEGEKAKDENVTFLVTLTEKSLAERFVLVKGKYKSLREYILSDSGRAACDSVKKSQAVAKASIKKLVANSDLNNSLSFSAVINGMTVVAPLSSQQKLRTINGVASVSVLYDDMYFLDEDEETSGEDESSAPEETQESSDPETSGQGEDGEDKEGEADAVTENLRKFAGVYDSLLGYDRELPYSGSGTLIAVIDSEFDVADGVFSALPQEGSLSAEALANLYKSIRFNASPDKGASQVYVSPKVVFAYDYAEDDKDTRDDSLFHGTAVAAVAAGNTSVDEQLQYKGVAPDAQLALMKVSSGRRTDGRIAVSTRALISALDDAAKLGADAVNLSLGSYDGIRNISTFEQILGRLSSLGIVVSGAAGNGGYNGYELGRVPSASDVFYSAENTLFEDGNMITAGSVSVPITFRRYITIGDRKIYYTNLNENKLSKIIKYTELVVVPEESSELTSIDEESNPVTSEDSQEESEISGDEEVTSADESEPSEESVPETPESKPESSEEPVVPQEEIRYVQDNRYVYVDSYKAEAGFGDKELTDKTLIINVKQTDDLEKALEAALLRGTAAILLINGGTSDAIRTVRDIPVAALEEDVSGYLLSRPADDTYDITLAGDPVESSSKKAVSSFTSFCATDSQGIGGRVLAPGENILAVPSRGEDAFISGTSSAAPCISGAVTLLKQYLREILPQGIDGPRLSDTASAVLLSSSEPVRLGNVYYSPRQQGFGLINIGKALTAGSCLTTNGNKLSAVELGDGDTGEYHLSFTVTNFSSEEKTYTPSFALQRDGVASDETGSRLDLMKPVSLAKSASLRLMTDENEIAELKLEPGQSADIEAVISIEDSVLSGLRESFPAGMWIDGYIFVKDNTGAVMSLPFSGFYGSLEDTDPFDKTVTDSEKSVTGLSSSYMAVALKGDRYASAELVFSGDRLLLSKDSVRCAEDDSTYSSSFILPDLYTLRDLYELTVKLYDSSGKQLYSEDLGFYSSYRHKDARPYEQLVNRSSGLREAFSKLGAGRYKYFITAKTQNANGSLGTPVSTSVDFEIDNKSPTGISSKTFTELGRIILELQANDENGIKGFRFYATAYDKKNNKYDYIDSIEEMVNAGYISSESCMLIDQTDNDDGSYVFRYDITYLQQELRKLSVSTTTWQNKVSDRKIAYKAIDSSGNASGVRIADVIEYGTAEFIFTDQNGRPARGVSVSIGDTKKTADAEGRVIFEDLEPDYYNARVTADEEYEIAVKSYIVSIYRDDLNYKAEQTVTFNGEYPPESSEEPENSSGSSVPADYTDEDRDKPLYVMLFVGAMLLLCAALFIIRKNANKR